MQIDHVARSTYSPHETHRFYTEVLGLRLTQAYAGEELMLVYALPGGGSLVFTTQRGGKRPRNSEVNWQREHVGLAVATRAELEGWLRRLDRYGVAHELVDDERVYFSDPDGLVLELEVACSTLIDPTASEVLARWRRDD
jgi:catechol 2,3-dioxygenase-like lactoylglutathione lyase family enzyme